MVGIRTEVKITNHKVRAAVSQVMFGCAGSMANVSSRLGHSNSRTTARHYGSNRRINEKINHSIMVHGKVVLEESNEYNAAALNTPQNGIDQILSKLNGLENRINDCMFFPFFAFFGR